MPICNPKYSHLMFTNKDRFLSDQNVGTCAEDLTQVSSLPLPMPGVGGTQAELNSD